MAAVTLSLPGYLQEFVDAEIADRGVVSRAQFVEQLVLKAYQAKHQEQLEQLLLCNAGARIVCGRVIHGLMPTSY